MPATCPAPFRRRMPHRRMAGLALLAILLLALVPTLGRLAQASAAGSDAAPSWAAMCTARGLESLRLPPSAHGLAHATGEAPSSPHSPHGSAGDCDYCPLLAATIPVAIATPSIPPAAAPPALCTSRPQPARTQPHPCGLGSRGPPTVS